MNDFAITAHNLGKCYRINAQRNNGRFRYRSFREEFAGVLLSPFRALRQGAALGNTEAFWALRNLDFTVMPGETVGIIGRNGAGKSTLLKVLSRISPPSTGEVRIRGRLGCLLEVGTGFHPELTGRENIFLNGAILGMKHREIRAKFDEIVAFSEIEKFLETPVKRYSSGMYVRLAFAVAAHLEPEILVVDEVLAVGDAAFQKKCLAKMEDVGKRGRTVLFVSHNMPSITRLCSRAILLKAGELVADGPAASVVASYLRSDLGTTAERSWPENARPGNEVVRLSAVRVKGPDGRRVEAAPISKPIDLEIEFEVLASGHVLVPNYYLLNPDGTMVFGSRDLDREWRNRPREPGRYRSICRIPGNLLTEGTHCVGVAISTMNPLRVHLSEADVVAFEVVDELEVETARGDFAGTIPGVVRPLLNWTTEFWPRNGRATARARS